MHKINTRFLPLLVLAILVNILAQTVHETGHHVVYQVMENEPVWVFTADGWVDLFYQFARGRAEK